MYNNSKTAKAVRVAIMFGAATVISTPAFSAETEDLIKNSIKKMKNKNCDLIFANDVSKKGIGFNSDR